MGWVAGTEITLTRRGPDGAPAEEIGVTDADDAWLWVRRPADPARADAVGTWRTPLPAGLAADLRALVGDVLGAPPGEGGHAALEVATADATRLVDPDDGPDARRLHAVAATITDLALENPVAVARFSAVPLAVDGPAPAEIALVVASPGREPVALTLDGGGLALRPSGGAGPVPLEAPPIGLLDASGELLDGIFAPARIPSRGLGSLVLASAPPAPGAAVVVTGRILLTGPWSGRSLPVPADAFVVEAPVASAATA